MTLSKRLNIAVGLVNALLKRAMLKGYVKARQAPYKRYAYYLTLKGFAEKSRLVSDYLESSLSFFRQARKEYAEIFQLIQSAGPSRLILFGNGELTEIALLAASAEGITVLAIIDPESNQDKRHGVPIVQEVMDVENIDAIILADARAPQKTYEMLRVKFPQLKLHAPGFMRIVQDARAGLEQADIEKVAQ